MPYNYQIYRRVFNEISRRMPDFKPSSLLDYGAGLGSAHLAALDYFPSTLKKVAAVEPAQSMKKLGKFLGGRINDDSNVLWVDALTMIPGTGGERGRFDVVMLG
jgi:ribosomal protein RSM22 (predicted rRNA methylase)